VNEENNMSEVRLNRVFARSKARELTLEEQLEVGGGNTGPNSFSQATSVPSGDVIPSFPDDGVVVVLSGS
jgi:hypothetical protein